MLIQLDANQQKLALSLIDGCMKAGGDGALAALRQAVATEFTPRAFIGLDGGLVQGMTTNCAIEYLVADHDTEGATEDEITHLSHWATDVVVRGPGYEIDAAACESLFADALADDEDENDQQ